MELNNLFTEQNKKLRHYIQLDQKVELMFSQHLLRPSVHSLTAQCPLHKIILPRNFRNFLCQGKSVVELNNFFTKHNKKLRHYIQLDQKVELMFSQQHLLIPIVHSLTAQCALHKITQHINFHFKGSKYIWIRLIRPFFKAGGINFLSIIII